MPTYKPQAPPCHLTLPHSPPPTFEEGEKAFVSVVGVNGDGCNRKLLENVFIGSTGDDSVDVASGLGAEVVFTMSGSNHIVLQFPSPLTANKLLSKMATNKFTRGMALGRTDGKDNKILRGILMTNNRPGLEDGQRWTKPIQPRFTTEGGGPTRFVKVTGIGSVASSAAATVLIADIRNIFTPYDSTGHGVEVWVGRSGRNSAFVGFRNTADARKVVGGHLQVSDSGKLIKLCSL